jgi:hypothetical protein
VLRYGGEQIVDANGFREESHGTQLTRLRFGIRSTSNEDQWNGRRCGIGLHRFQELEPAHERHLDIGENEIRALLEQSTAGDYRILSQFHVIARGAKMQAQKLAHQFIVVYHQDSCGHAGSRFRYGWFGTSLPVLIVQSTELTNIDAAARGTDFTDLSRLYYRI